MTLDKETKVVLQGKFVFGEREIQKLEDAWEVIVSGFTAASAQYGSKFAGSDGGDKIREKIGIAKARLAPLRKVILGDLDISEKASTDRIDLMCGLDRAIGILQKERERINNEIHEVGIVEGILKDRLFFVD